MDSACVGEEDDSASQTIQSPHQKITDMHNLRSSTNQNPKTTIHMSLSDELSELIELKKAGRLTHDEYAAAKSRALKQGKAPAPSHSGNPVSPYPEIQGTSSPQISQPKAKRPIGMTIYASLNLALCALTVVGATMALASSTNRQITGILSPVISLAMVSVLAGSMIGFLRGARWGRSLLICYAAIWLLSKALTWQNEVDNRLGGGQEGALVLMMALIMTWFTFPLFRSKWMGYLSPSVSQESGRQ